MTRFAVGLGSNVGDRIGHLRSAVLALEEWGSLVAVSGLYETAPIGGPEQDPFLNAVVIIESGKTPVEVLEICQLIEEEGGRVRGQRWGPRTLDLDLITSDGPRVDKERLILPHPRAHLRRFVLEPLSEVWPKAEVGEGRVAAEALSEVAGQDVTLVAREWMS